MVDQGVARGEGGPPPVRRRLPATERERQIVEAAARYFAEHGFDGRMRGLARAIGISHPAIFRYFPTKEALIERVYEHVYLARWDPAWPALIRDRSQPLETRLIRFYREYADRIFNYVWVRIFIQSALNSYDITPRHLALLDGEVIRPICVEYRAELGLPPPEIMPLTERELELAWAMHGNVFYFAVRKFVYGMPITGDHGPIVAEDVRMFFRGARPAFEEVFSAAASSN